jgi:hypothetical protein
MRDTKPSIRGYPSILKPGISFRYFFRESRRPCTKIATIREQKIRIWTSTPESLTKTPRELQRKIAASI